MRALPALPLPLLLIATLIAQDPPAAPPAAKFTLSGHTDKVYSVAVSADGRLIATGSFDQSVKLWDAATGKELRTLAGANGHKNLVTAVTFSLDGGSVASASTDNSVRVWDVPTGRPATALELAANGTAVTVSNDGKLFAAGAADGSVRVFNAADNKVTQTLAPANTGAVHGLGFSSNGQMLYTLAADRVLRYWNVADGKPLGAVGASADAVAAFAVNPGSSQPLVATADGLVAAFPPNPPNAPKPLPGLSDAATAFALSGDGNVAVTATADKKMKAVRTGDAGVAFEITLPAAATLLSVNGNGSQVTAVVGGVLHLFDGSGKPRAVLPTGPLLDVALHPNQPQFVTLGADGIARTWTVPNSPPALKPLAHPDAVRAVASAPGNKVLTAGADKVVRVWNNDRVEREFKDHTVAVVDAAVAADNIVSADADGTVLFWNPNDGKPTAKLDCPKKAIVALGVRPGSKAVAVAYADGEVRYYPEPSTADKDAKSFPHPKPVLAVTFTQDNQRVVTLCADGKGRVWNPESAKEGGSFDLTAKDKLAAVAVSGDRSKLVEVGGGSLTVRPLTADGKPVFTAPFADTAVAAAWSGDGRLLAVSATDAAKKQVVKVFDAATGVELQTVAEPTAAATALLFLPDNKTLLVGGADKQLAPAEVWVSGTRATTTKPTLATLIAGGNTAAVATADKTVRLFEVNPAPDAKEVKAFAGLPADAKQIALSRDGQVVAAVSGKTLKAWQTGDGKELSLTPLPADGTSLAFSNDRNKLAVALADNTAVIVALNTGRIEQFVPHTGAIAGLAFHPSQPVLYTASADKTVQGTPLANPRLTADDGRYGKAFAVTPNGGNTLSAGKGKGVTVANAGNGNTDRTLGELAGVTAVAANKANNRVAAFTPADQSITLYDLGNGTEYGRWKAPAAVTELAFHPKQNAVLGVLADQRVMAWNVEFNPGQPLPPEFGQPVLEFPHPVAVKGVAFLGDELVLTVADDKQLRVWKWVSDSPSRTLQHPNLVNAVAFDNTGTRVATGGQDGILRVWDVSKPQVPGPKAINAHTQPQPQPIYAVVWTPDGKTVFTASNDQTVKAWTVDDGKMVWEIKPGTDKPPLPEAVKATAAAAVGGAGEVELKLPPPPGHTDQVYTLAITADGKYLASGSADRTIKLWEAATGQPVRTFVNPAFTADGTAHPGFVQSVRFTPDGSKLVSVGTAPKNKGFLAVWNVADGKLLAGYELDVGPIYSVDVTTDGTAVLGCGPQSIRGPSDSDAVVLPLTK